MKVNMKLLKRVKVLGHCLCNLSLKCPCEEFLKTKECKCGVYEKE